MSDETNVVTATEVAPKKEPQSFTDLTKPQLVEAAKFFGTETEGGVRLLRVDLEENGVTWDMYVKQFLNPDAEVDQPEKFEMPPATNVDDWPDAPEGGEEVTDVITAAPSPVLQAQEKYLIKFIGENPYFEFGNYRFSQDKPYGIMPAVDAQKALVNEPTKFRQAYPAELQEFYS